MRDLPRTRAKGVLVIESKAGQIPREFHGLLYGAPVSASSIREAKRLNKDKGFGEVVFNTSMTGYQEILTDPSYYGQIITMTTPHIGNTGANSEDIESARAWAAGFIFHAPPVTSSNWRSQVELEEYLKEYGIPGLIGVDTRAVTLHLRTLGVTRGVILPFEERDKASALLAELPLFEGRDLIREVTTEKPYEWLRPKGIKLKYKVVALDFGAKWNLFRSLVEHLCSVEVFPANTRASEILAREPDGVFLSNGPGDPSAAPYAVQTVKELLGKVPIFGVCMGHQILALALGGKTYKLKFGHRGGNQPVLDKVVGKVEISSHNHGYSVDIDSLPKSVELTHVNLNDHTVEGIAAHDLNAFSVQYHPEACPGPHDSAQLFSRFTEAMDRKKHVPTLS